MFRSSREWQSRRVLTHNTWNLLHPTGPADHRQRPAAVECCWSNWVGNNTASLYQSELTSPNFSAVMLRGRKAFLQWNVTVSVGTNRFDALRGREVLTRCWVVRPSFPLLRRWRCDIFLFALIRLSVSCNKHPVPFVWCKTHFKCTKHNLLLNIPFNIRILSLYLRDNSLFFTLHTQQQVKKPSV